MTQTTGGRISGYLWRHPRSLGELWNLTTDCYPYHHPLGCGDDAVRALLLLGFVSPHGNHLILPENGLLLKVGGRYTPSQGRDQTDP